KGFLRRNWRFITLRQQSSQLRKLPLLVACTGSFVIPHHQNLPIFMQPSDTTGDAKLSTVLVRSRLRRLICPLSLALPRRRVFGNADHSGADRTSDRAGAAQE